jgi:agmatine deiminase
VQVHTIVTDDAWCRDHGAIFVHDAHGERVALQFRFNAWGGKYPHAADAAVAAQMAQALALRCLPVDLVLEGGSIEVNGAGAVLTTEQCLLNPNRNPGRSRAEIEALLCTFLGVDAVLWLGDGIVGDDTDGHIDDLTRFVGPATVVTAVESDPADANFAVLRDNLQRLRRMSLADGTPLSVVELPMPAPVMGAAGRLPASYANFYVGNEVVLLPVFSCPQDEAAIAILARCYPGRRIVPIDCRALVVGLGTLHCLTQQIPASARAGAATSPG